MTERTRLWMLKECGGPAVLIQREYENREALLYMQTHPEKIDWVSILKYHQERMENKDG